MTRRAEGRACVHRLRARCVPVLVLAAVAMAGACMTRRDDETEERPASSNSRKEAGAEADIRNPTQDRRRDAVELMLGFAERTGLTGAGTPRRYLWTDAFAVCNFLGLARVTGEERYEELALRLVDRVHHTLGWHRPDDPRTGWISGLSASEGEQHPTRGGLRIGKELPERQPGEPIEERLEWERDGQYFHYLTQWMHALDQAARATGQPAFNRWARELAETAHATFTDASPGAGRRMYWKMSIDLSRPLVSSMGQHDPLAGYITCLQLRATRSASSVSEPDMELEAATAGFRSMIDGRDLATADPLGIGGLLADACRLEQLMRQGASADAELLVRMLAAAHAGLERYARQADLQEPATRRLAFRELGLAIGLQAVVLMSRSAEGDPQGFPGGPAARARLEALMRHADLRGRIEAFWLDPRHRIARTWTEHRDINEVMLATSLAPEGFLVLDNTVVAIEKVSE
jgi:hypothetical protein